MRQEASLAKHRGAIKLVQGLFRTAAPLVSPVLKAATASVPLLHPNLPKKALAGMMLVRVAGLTGRASARFLGLAEDHGSHTFSSTADSYPGLSAELRYSSQVGLFTAFCLPVNNVLFDLLFYVS